MHFLTLLIVTSVLGYSSSNTSEWNLKEWIQSYTSYTCYKCFNSECFNFYNKTCDGALQCFTHITIVDNKRFLIEKGCLKAPFIMHAMCYYGKARMEQNDTFNVMKCCQGNLCNDEEFVTPSTLYLRTTPSIPHLWTTQSVILEEVSDTGDILDGVSNTSSKIKNEWFYTEQADSQSIIFPVCTSIAVFFLSLGAASVVSVRKIASDEEKENSFQRFYFKPTITFTDTFISFLTFRSGSSSLSLNQRTLAQDITLVRCIGQGCYGEVWLGTKLGENVAVKIFTSSDKDLWENEVNIYSDFSLCHENILGFKGSRFDTAELWLLTTFHEQGSLYGYLFENTVTHKQMIEFVRSACSGLLYLHVEIFSFKGKPGIAHRNLKTRNILLTPHGTCVIADFGLAIVRDISKMPINYRVGTKRYMAPEVLDESIDLSTFESFKRTDIYAFGLIMWEICSRCVLDGTTKAYRPPYDEQVPSNPDFEDLIKVVCVELKRPEIPDRWSSDKPLDAMAKLMKLCWHKNPKARYSAYRILKSLDKICAQIQELQSNECLKSQK